MKILQDKYPMGSYKGQKSRGRYIDGVLYQNLELLADAIIKDMTFLGVCYSSTLEVGTGKSVKCTQIGEAWCEIMNRKHNLQLSFTSQNLVWRPEELIKRAFEVPRYSFLLLDEWEDAGYWSKLGMTLRQFFRKCRQLNLFIMVIIPNFFQLPLNYATSRSVFAIDVRFQEGFERGYFYFYGFDSKRKLYIKGKRDHNYHVSSPDFYGRFSDGYGLPEQEYRQSKLKDMMEYDNDDKKPLTEADMKIKIFNELKETLPEISQKRLSEAFGVSERTGCRWVSKEYGGKMSPLPDDTDTKTTYNNILIRNKVVDGMEGEQPNDTKKK